MRNSPRAALLLAIAVTLLASVASEIAAQTPTPKKKKGTAPVAATATTSSGTAKSGAKKGSAFEIKDFSFGVENPTTTGSGSGDKAGKVSFSDFTVGATKSKQPAVYKGPITLPPNNAPKPNDSAHKRPPH